MFRDTLPPWRGFTHWYVSTKTATVVWWSECLATYPEVLGLIPGPTRFSVKLRVWNGVHSAPWGKLRSYLNGKVAASVWKTKINSHGNSLHWPCNTLYPQRLTPTSPTSGGCSIGIVRLRTVATEYVSTKLKGMSFQKTVLLSFTAPRPPKCCASVTFVQLLLFFSYHFWFKAVLSDFVHRPAVYIDKNCSVPGMTSIAPVQNMWVGLSGDSAE
jgi:hypothetical protein